MAKVPCRDMSVYMHKNIINGKIYIGQTNNIEKRWEYNGVHYHYSSYFYNALIKYGWDNFEHIILKSNLTEEEANYWEDYYIKYYDALNRNKGYNLKTGGDNYHWSQEIKEKIKNSNKKTWNQIKTEKPEYYTAIWEEHGKKVSKAVICLNNNMIFKNQLQAAEWCGLKSTAGISKVCLGQRQSAGRHPETNEKLVWKFYDIQGE